MCFYHSATFFSAPLILEGGIVPKVDILDESDSQKDRPVTSGESDVIFQWYDDMRVKHTWQH